MSDDKSLVIRESAPQQYGLARPDIMTANDVQAMLEIAKVVCTSAMSKHKTAQDAFFVMCLGRELGIQPITALRTIYSVNGVPTCSSEAMLALIRSSGKADKITINGDNLRAEVYMKRRDTAEDHTAIFTMEDAKRAGLTSKQPWIAFPATMLKWRAVSNCAKFLFSDVIGGLYTHEEINPDGKYNENGDFVDAEVVITTTPNRTHAPQAPTLSNDHLHILDGAEKPTTQNMQKQAPAPTPVHFTATKAWQDKFFKEREKKGIKTKEDADALYAKMGNMPSNWSGSEASWWQEFHKATDARPSAQPSDGMSEAQVQAWCQTFMQMSAGEACQQSGFDDATLKNMTNQEVLESLQHILLDGKKPFFVTQYKYKTISGKAKLYFNTPLIGGEYGQYGYGISMYSREDTVKLLVAGTYEADTVEFLKTVGETTGNTWVELPFALRVSEWDTKVVNGKTYINIVKFEADIPF